MMLAIISGLDMSCCCMRLMSMPPPSPPMLPIMSAKGLDPAAPPAPAAGMPKGWAVAAAGVGEGAGAGGRACDRMRCTVLLASTAEKKHPAGDEDEKRRGCGEGARDGVMYFCIFTLFQ